jgi:hypothetical protein
MFTTSPFHCLLDCGSLDIQMLLRRERVRPLEHYPGRYSALQPKWIIDQTFQGAWHLVGECHRWWWDHLWPSSSTEKGTGNRMNCPDHLLVHRRTWLVGYLQVLRQLKDAFAAPQKGLQLEYYNILHAQVSLWFLR